MSVPPDKQFVALVLAADRTTTDPITLHTGAPCKAVAPVGGVPMIIRVLNALEASRFVSSTLLCGPSESILSACPELKERIDDNRIRWVSNRDSPSRSAEHGIAQLDVDTPVLLTTADHALLTAEIVDYFLSQSLTVNNDATVGVVQYKDIVAAFPDAKRTVIRLKDGGYCGTNLFSFHPKGRPLVGFWRQVEALRKRPWQIVTKILSVRIIFSYLFGALTLKAGVNAVSEKAGVNIQPVILPFPRAGVDVDTVVDLQLAESVLTQTSQPVSRNETH